MLSPTTCQPFLAANDQFLLHVEEEVRPTWTTIVSSPSCPCPSLSSAGPPSSPIRYILSTVRSALYCASPSSSTCADDTSPTPPKSTWSFLLSTSPSCTSSKSSLHRVKVLDSGGSVYRQYLRPNLRRRIVTVVTLELLPNRTRQTTCPSTERYIPQLFDMRRYVVFGSGQDARHLISSSQLDMSSARL